MFNFLFSQLYPFFGRVVFFFLCLVSALFAAGIHFQWIKNSKGKQFRFCGKIDCDQMEEGEQYSEYLVERNPRSYMSMRDYINQLCQSQEPVERNSSEYMSMRDYRNQWMSSPYGSVYNHSWGNHTNSSWEPRPPQNAPPELPFYASTPQSPQPPQSIPPFEQAILDLTRIMDDFMAENKEINAHSDQRIVTVDDNLNKKIDGLKNDFEHKWDYLQDSIENHINQQQCLEEKCLIDTMVEKHSEQQLQEEMIEDFVEVVEGLSESSNIGVTFWPWKKEEQISALITEEGSGIEAGKEPQKLTLQPIPMKLNPTATAQATKNPLPVAPSTDQVYILPSPAAQSTPKTPTLKATQFALLGLSNFKRLVAFVQNFSTTSKTQAVAYIAWHSCWFGCRFGFGAPKPGISKLHQFQQPPKA